MTMTHYEHVDALLELQSTIHMWAKAHPPAALNILGQHPRSRFLLRTLAADFSTLETAILAALDSPANRPLSPNSQNATEEGLTRTTQLP